MEKEPQWVEEIRQEMKQQGLYTALDALCEESRKEYEKVLKKLDPSYRTVIERYVELLNRCNFQHINKAFFLGKEEGEKRNKFK